MLNWESDMTHPFLRPFRMENRSSFTPFSLTQLLTSLYQFLSSSTVAVGKP